MVFDRVLVKIVARSSEIVRKTIANRCTCMQNVCATLTPDSEHSLFVVVPHLAPGQSVTITRTAQI